MLERMRAEEGDSRQEVHPSPELQQPQLVIVSSLSRDDRSVKAKYSLEAKSEHFR